MIIWSGFGFIVPLLAFIQFMILGYFELLNSSNLIFIMLYFFPLSLLLWPIGRKLNSPSSKLISRQGFRFFGGHTFFFLRIEVWSIITSILGIIGLIGILTK